MSNEWHLIHDFIQGYGYMDDSGQTVWWIDAERFLGKKEIKPEQCDALYEEIRWHLIAEAAKNTEVGHFDRFTIPKVKKIMAKLNTKTLCRVQPMY